MNRGFQGGAGGRFESPVIPLAPGGTNLFVTFGHGHGRPPKTVRWALVCQQPDAGYSPGDQLEPLGFSNGGLPPTTWSSGAQLGLIFPSSAFNWDYAHKTTGTSTALTNSKWAVKCYAEWA